MLSVLKPGYIYSSFSEDVADHDDDFDAEEWNYNGREVFRGCLDPTYPDWNVYWLYDDNLIRVGLAEHDPESPEVFHSLWFYDNPFGTLFQENGWVKKGTLWPLLSPEAYQDCLEDDFKTVFDRALGSNIRLMTPGFITNRPKVYHCQTCNKKSLSPLCSEATVYDYLFSDFSILFLDDSFVLYTAPSDSKVWSNLSLNPPQPDACEPEHQEQTPPEQADLPESQTAQSPLELEQSQQEPETQELQPQ